MDWYLRFFKGAEGYKAVGEFSTSYLRKQSAPEQILESLGTIKIIVCIRNPIERFLSEYRHLIRNGHLPRNEFMTLDMERYHEVISLGLHILEKGEYSRNIKRYFDTFGTHRVLVVDNRAMRDNPDAVLHKTYTFLGVDARYRPPIMDKRISRGVIPKSEYLDRIRRSIWRWSRNHYPGLIDIVKRFSISDLYRKVNAGEFRVSDEVIEDLNRYYTEEFASLEALLGRDLAWSGFE